MSASTNKPREVDLLMDDLMIEVRGQQTEQVQFEPKKQVHKGKGYIVHEHLLRERSKRLADEIDEKKKKAKGNKRAIIDVYASKRMVGCWLGWLYGQPMFTWGDDIHDEVLENYIEMYQLAREEDDIGCMNACLDTIRDYLCQPSGLENPIHVLKPVLESGLPIDGNEDDDDRENNMPANMIVDVLVYGPCADSGQTAEWLKCLEVYSVEDWAWFYQRFGSVSAAKLAQVARDPLIPGNTSGSMAAHKYHFCKKGEKLCCGRKVPVGAKKRKAISVESEGGDLEEIVVT